MAFIRKVRTASGATAVQIAYKQKGKVVKILHIGSAHTKEDLNILVTLARKRLHANQLSLFPESQPSLRVGIKNPIPVYCGTFCANNTDSWGLTG